jgi:hypothetical protein
MSNKKFRKNFPPEQEFIKFQEDFCKVLDVFEYRGKKFTDDKALRLLMMACFMIDVYAKSELNQKDYEFMKERIIFNMLNDNRVLDTEDDKDRVIH